MTTRTRHTLTAVLIALAGLSVVSCRGGISTSPPVHLVQDMDFQAKTKAQSENAFFADHRGMRKPPEGTIAHSYAYHHGTEPLQETVDAARRAQELAVFKDAAGNYIDNPVTPTAEVMARGQERFNIYCSVCHGYSGRGGNREKANGTVGARWPVPIPSFIDDERVSKLRDGDIFDVITNSRGTMPAYGHMVSVEDRWAIIHYIRALQYQAKN